MKQLLLLTDYKNGDTGSERLGNLPITTQAEGAGARITLCPNSLLYTSLTLHLGEGTGEDSSPLAQVEVGHGEKLQNSSAVVITLITLSTAESRLDHPRRLD